MILVIDNYDSFTYNLVQYVGEMGKPVTVFRNDQINLDQAMSLKPTHLIISPGPGTPQDAKISNDLIKYFADKIPILGVCLGHQCIASVFGGEVIQNDHIVHGKTSEIYHNGRTLFAGLPNPFSATRYHSLIVKEETLPENLIVTAHTKEGEVMGIKHKDYLCEGVQFHPESVLTKEGKQILQNFFNL